jgi:hypothetical protein
MALSAGTLYSDVPSDTITAGMGAFREALMRAYAMQGGDEAAARFRRMYEMGPDKRWVETKEGALDAEQRFLSMVRCQDGKIGVDGSHVLNYAMA